MVIVELAYDEATPRELAEAVSRVVNEALGVSSSVVERPLRLPRALYDEVRGQYLAEGLAHYASSYRRGEYLVLLANVDGYVRGLNFVFGLAVPALATAVVFLRRLYYLAGPEQVFERALKEVLHELGHLLGLRHCAMRGCVMNFSNSLAEVNGKTYKFCPRCSSALSARGIKVSEGFQLRPLR